MITQYEPNYTKKSINKQGNFTETVHCKIKLQYFQDVHNFIICILISTFYSKMWKSTKYIYSVTRCSKYIFLIPPFTHIIHTQLSSWNCAGLSLS